MTSIAALSSKYVSVATRLVDDPPESFELVFRRRFDEFYTSLFRYLDRLSGDFALAADIAAGIASPTVSPRKHA